MKQTGWLLYDFLRGSILHPQWLTDRFHFASRRRLQQLRDCLILDIGSGNSRNAKFLHVSNNVLRLDYPDTNTRYRILPELFADACQLPIADTTLDSVLLLEVMEHIGDYEKAIREIQRVLKPEGKLFASVPFLYPIHDAPYDYFRFTAHGIHRILEQSGFEIIEMRQHGNSVLVPMQLLNLAALEASRAIWRKFSGLGLLALVAGYPVCLTINLLSWPLTLLPNVGASCFGYFVVAKRR